MNKILIKKEMIIPALEKGVTVYYGNTGYTVYSKNDELYVKSLDNHSVGIENVRDEFFIITSDVIELFKFYNNIYYAKKYDSQNHSYTSMEDLNYDSQKNRATHFYSSNWAGDESVYEANYRAMLEICRDKEHVKQGGVLYLPLESIFDKEIEEILDGIESYLVISDEKLSEVEMEMENEAIADICRHESLDEDIVYDLLREGDIDSHADGSSWYINESELLEKYSEVFPEKIKEAEKKLKFALKNKIYQLVETITYDHSEYGICLKLFKAGIVEKEVYFNFPSEIENFINGVLNGLQ